MSTYTPQVGDRVRRTYPDGTFMEGVIARVCDRWALSESGLHLYNGDRPEQTVLLERPVKLNTEPGTVYGFPGNNSHRVVLIGPDDDDTLPWLGDTGADMGWLSHEEIEGLIRDHGWVEYNLDGTKK